MATQRPPPTAQTEIKHRKFTEDEDSEILRLVTEHGVKDWSLIAAKLGGGRTGRQVRERWHNYVNPKLQSEYTEAEDQLIVSLYEQLGPKWSAIAGHLQGKSPISVRNRQRTLETSRMKGFKPDYERTARMRRSLEPGSSESGHGPEPRWKRAAKSEQDPEFKPIQEVGPFTDQIDAVLCGCQEEPPSEWDGNLDGF